MWRAILFLTLAILCSAVVVAFVSVYVFHDVDRDKIGHWNEAFADLAVEAVIFALLIGIPTELLAMLGQYLLTLRGYAPRAGIGIILGIAVTICQYLFEFLGRRFFPAFVDLFLSTYLVVAVLVCVVVLLLDTRSRKLNAAPISDSTHS
jgi:hypothetical protein